MSARSVDAGRLGPLWDPAPAPVISRPSDVRPVGIIVPVRHSGPVKKFRPPSWAEPEPGEETVEVFYTDGIPTQEIQLPSRWRIARKLETLVRPPGRHRKA